jgi:alkanesulfonate monooxygenase SsuD/methylene tetrahydromethanopterin reductase-like flavin-dependent oxidoreductase (luciferase family)
MATRTERVRLGPMLTPVSRRRPWKLASEVATLDRLSKGRALLPVGLGAPDTGFDQVGEATDRKTRARLMDEGLALLGHFWSGKPFRYRGEHYTVDWTAGWPYAPVQQPRVPIWVVGAWPRKASMRHALPYDGMIAVKMENSTPFGTITPDDIRQVRAFVDEQRSAETPFDIVIEGITPGGDPEQAAAQLRPFAEAGVTWWIESMWDVPGGQKAMRKRIKQGPPRLAAT